jgi:hypothetical protein
MGGYGDDTLRKAFTERFGSESGRITRWTVAWKKRESLGKKEEKRKMKRADAEPI